MTKRRGRQTQGVWFSTSISVASGASAATEIDIRGLIPTQIVLAQALNPSAYIGFKGRPVGFSTAQIIYDTENSQPLQIVTNSTGKIYPIPTNPGLAGLSFLTVYTKSTSTSKTSVVNQTGGAKTLFVEGIG